MVHVPRQEIHLLNFSVGIDRLKSCLQRMIYFIAWVVITSLLVLQLIVAILIEQVLQVICLLCISLFHHH
jgi:hypothetical protein